jgi:hypothetical protein
MWKFLNLCSLVAIFLVPAVWAQESMAIKALRAAPRQTSIYELSFSTNEALAVDAEIRLTFPAAYDLSGLEIAGSTTINGGLTLTRDGQRVVVKRTGLGTVVPRGQKVGLQLGLIKNPSNFATAEQVRVEVLHSKKATAAKAFASSVEFQSR